MFDKDICVIDLETTGTLERTVPTRITEIGIIRLEKHNYGVVDRYQSYVNPEEKLSEFIIHYTGITDEKLKDAPKFKDIADNVSKICKDATIAAWPLNFEMPILQWEYANAGINPFPLNRRGIDIGTLASFYLHKNNIPLKKNPSSKELSYSLDNIRYTLGMPQQERRHSAVDDTIAECQVLIEVIGKLNK